MSEICRLTRRAVQVLAVTIAIMLSAATAHAAAEVCRAAGARAAKSVGVPVAVLTAISLTETGRNMGGRLEPWPWTVNMEGAGKWFDTRAEAEAYVTRHHERGARSYDVGCFQINYRWHGAAFPSPQAMFDPDRNATYAAQFLRALYAETGSWSKAAGAYHSRTPKFANRYRKRFERILARLTGGSAPPPPEFALAQPGVIPSGGGGNGTAGGAPAGAPTPAPGAGLAPRAAAQSPAPAPPVHIVPIDVAGPLTISPPQSGTGGSLASLAGGASGVPLLSAPPGPLFQ